MLEQSTSSMLQQKSELNGKQRSLLHLSCCILRPLCFLLRNGFLLRCFCLLRVLCFLCRDCFLLLLFSFRSREELVSFLCVFIHSFCHFFVRVTILVAILVIMAVFCMHCSGMVEV